MEKNLRIATWNLESKKSLTAEKEGVFRHAMNAINADIWILTETWTIFLPLEGYQTVAQSAPAADLKASDNRCWVTIWSRIGGEQLDVHHQADRMTCVRLQQADKRPLLIVGTVLPWRSDSLWPGAAGFCAALAEQVGEWEKLWKMYPDHCSVIAGDLNQAIPNHPNYGTKQGSLTLNNAMQTHGLRCLTEGNNPLSGEPYIDHILFGPIVQETDPIRKACTWSIPMINGKPMTDHFGVYADLDVLPRP